MTKPAVSILVVLAGMQAACAGPTWSRSASVAGADTVTPPVEVPLYVDACPLSHLRGVRARVADVPMGVAIMFEAPNRAVGLLRGNVHEMARASRDEGNPFAICPCRDTGTGSLQATRAAGKGDLGATMMQPATNFLPPAGAVANDTPTGATLVLTSADDEEALLLRSAARREVSAMGECLAGVRY